jgi:Domain of unknown function (DUF4149)
MMALRYTYILALVVWLGGTIVIGAVVAPATFNVLEQADAAAGRVRAATVVGEVLRRFHLVTYVAGGALLASLFAMKVVGPRPVGFGIRAGIVSVMLAASLVAGTFVNTRIAGLRDEIGAPIASLAPEDPRRLAFGRLHTLSLSLMALGALGGLALCYWETRE